MNNVPLLLAGEPRNQYMYVKAKQIMIPLHQRNEKKDDYKKPYRHVLSSYVIILTVKTEGCKVTCQFNSNALVIKLILLYDTFT